MAKIKIEIEGIDSVLASLARIERLLRANLSVNQQQTERIQAMAMNLSELAAEVEGNSDVVASAERVLEGLVEQLENAGGNQSEVDAITAQLKEQKARLAEAIANVGPHAETNG